MHMHVRITVCVCVYRVHVLTGPLPNCYRIELVAFTSTLTITILSTTTTKTNMSNSVFCLSAGNYRTSLHDGQAGDRAEKDIAAIRRLRGLAFCSPLHTPQTHTHNTQHQHNTAQHTKHTHTKAPYGTWTIAGAGGLKLERLVIIECCF